MSRKEYNHAYYMNIYRDKVKDLKLRCETCNCEYSKWNESKHYKSKKHQLQLMTTEEKMKFIEDKVKAMESKIIAKMKMKYCSREPSTLQS